MKSNQKIYLPEIKGEWRNDRDTRKYVIEAVESGVPYLFTQDGIKMPLGRNLAAELTQAQAVLTTKEAILTDWIRKGMPCAKRYGFAYRGAQARPITATEAETLLPRYSFGKGFYELRFELLGVPSLVFNEYSENDMW